MDDYLADRFSSTIIYTKRRPFNALALLSLILGGIIYLQYNRDPVPIPIPIPVPVPAPAVLYSNAATSVSSPSPPPVLASETDSHAPLLPNHGTPGTVIRSPGRELDVQDAFADYNRIPDTCSLSSLDLHDPFAPLCTDKQTFLDAASGGGRAGVDQPYQPRACDMRWFHTHEICEIMSRFDAIWIIGDSMMRNTAVALMTLLRADLYEGPRAQWNPAPDDLNCHCRGPFETAACMWYVALSTKDVWEHIKEGEPHSIKCPQNSMAKVEYIPETAYPLADSVSGIVDRLSTERPAKPQAFILGHGIWNALNETASGLWLDEVETSINETSPWVTAENALFPRLFITPNAAGDNKPVQYQETQGNVALHRFENNMGPYLRSRGIDHLGMYNATIQNTTPDGTHAGMRSNLLKAMFLLNWLHFIDVTKHDR